MNVSGITIDHLSPVRVDSLKPGDEFVVNSEVPVYTMLQRLPHGATGMVSLLCHTKINKRDLTMTFYAGHMVSKVV